MADQPYKYWVAFRAGDGAREPSVKPFDTEQSAERYYQTHKADWPLPHRIHPPFGASSADEALAHARKLLGNGVH